MASQERQGLANWQTIALRSGATSDYLRRDEIIKSWESTPSPTSPATRYARTSQASSFTTTSACSEHSQQQQLPLRLSASPHLPIDSISTPTPSDVVVMAIDPTLQSLTQFMNASLIQQKRLKANHSQITMVTKQFRDSRAQYELSFTSPPSTTSAIRAQMYANLQKYCTRYDGLLELRRQMLEKQQAWLEAALDAPVLKDSMQLGLAIDMQIEAAKELAVIEKEAKLKSALEILWPPS